jgi:hypothetical protein
MASSLNFLRRERRAVTAVAEPLDPENSPGAVIPSPAEEVVSKEEQTILWRSLAEIPELYREPLILFYRENQSVEKVAAALDLSEGAVKQRLSRGRQMLKDQVAAFVESGLRNSRPKQAFTAGVIAALSAHSAKAAVGVAAVSAKALGVLKPALAFGVSGAVVGSFWGWAGGLLGGICGLAGGLSGVYFPIKVALRIAKSDRERQHIEAFARRMYWMMFIFLGLNVGTAGASTLFRHIGGAFQLWLVAANIVFSGVLAALCGLECARYNKGLKQIQKEQGGADDPEVQLQTLLQNTRARRLTMPVHYKTKVILLVSLLILAVLLAVGIAVVAAWVLTGQSQAGPL